ncbi:hypothetical protein BCR34DRAFT_210301 [Clohesyomyces aquaticus]|uniref:Uncharacterized protein n=1 Tax=Clohesyomyces aquaticus TaxID=1231657 RepID=A0A1Y2A9X1_9PLEO|nr:hypothetical protein BCR34DRAFT_210301 [Clohesyomyces aquaticus]
MQSRHVRHKRFLVSIDWNEGMAWWPFAKRRRSENEVEEEIWRGYFWNHASGVNDKLFADVLAGSKDNMGTAKTGANFSAQEGVQEEEGPVKFDPSMPAKASTTHPRLFLGSVSWPGDRPLKANPRNEPVAHPYCLLRRSIGSHGWCDLKEDGRMGCVACTRPGWSTRDATGLLVVK